MLFFRIVWTWICVLITFLARNVYLIIIIFVPWMLKTFSSLVRWTFSISAMAVATEAAASALTTQQLESRRVPSPYVQSRSHSQLTLAVSAQHGGDLDAYYNRSTREWIQKDTRAGLVHPEALMDTMRAPGPHWTGVWDDEHSMEVYFRGVPLKWVPHMLRTGCCVLSIDNDSGEAVLKKRQPTRKWTHIRSCLMSRGCATSRARLYVIVQVPL